MTPSPTTANPTEPPPVSAFTITLSFDASVPTDDQADFQRGAQRWERVITGDLVDIDGASIPADLASPCTFPDTIDDIFVCVYYEQLSPGLAGQGGYRYTRSNDGLPVAGFMRFDPEQVVVARAVGALDSLITHEMGHVLGIGTLGGCPSNGNSKANTEYQQLSQCATNVPAADPSCNHLAESCLQTELMSPGISANAPMSRITIGWLEDLGYQVNYFAADPFDRSMLGASCVCNNERSFRSGKRLGKKGGKKRQGRFLRAMNTERATQTERE
jgi:hypothetical protein